MSIFNIFARIKLDSAEFEAGMKRAESSVAALGKTIGRYFTAGAIGYGLLNLARSAFRAAGEVNDLAEALGITTDEVQSLQKAAQNSGNSLEQYASALLKVKKLRSEALGGNASASEKFKAAGIDPSGTPLEILSALGDPKKFAEAADIIGIKSAKILGSLSQIKQLGPLEIITPESAKTLDEAEEKVGSLWRMIKAITANTIGGVIRTDWQHGLGVGIAAGYLNRKIAEAGRAAAAGLPGPGESLEFGEFDWGGGMDWKKGRARERQRKASLASLDDPLGLSFQSSNPDSLRQKGGFFIGADRNAAMDVQKQQLAKATIAADRLDKMERQLSKLTQEAES